MNEVFKTAKDKMKKTVESLRNEYVHIRTGRATPNMLDSIKIDYYGAPTPLNQAATITIPDARLIVVSPFEPKFLAEIEKAIQKSDLGITPLNDGRIIRLPIPEMTEDRRKNIVKSIKKMGEDAKVAIRNIRREANDQLKKLEKSSDITEDDLHKGMDDIQKDTDDFTEKIDELMKEKEKEIMEV